MILNIDKQSLENLYDNATLENPQVQVIGIQDNILAVVTVNGNVDLEKPKVTLTYGLLYRAHPSECNFNKDLNLTNAISLNPDILKWADIEITTENPLYFTACSAWDLDTNEIGFESVERLVSEGYENIKTEYNQYITTIDK